MTPIDLHTHTSLHHTGEAVVNCSPTDFQPREGEWYSVGIHPWHVASTAFDEEPLLAALRHPQVLAVGEAGLDKLAKAPMPLQIEAFRRQAMLAEEVQKPLIIHLVKATDELLRLRRDLQPTVPWIIHGFRGKAPLAALYLRHGFHLSFGEKYQEAALRIVPDTRLFLETDESLLPIQELYTRAAAIRRTTPPQLIETVRQNITSILHNPSRTPTPNPPTSL